MMPAMSIRIFRGIRYGHAARFEPAEIAPLDIVPDEGVRGPVSPQAPSRLDATIMGPAAPLAQSEHCQVLSVFTPALEGRRPVMVFLHGGAFVTGGGELPWYDGARLAAEQDVVVVSVTYRLGALGYIHFPGGSGPSPGMSDQIAALKWIKRHIAAFGGDPDNVTMFGQSAGGMSIVTLMDWGFGGQLFHRAILQSGAAGLARRRDQAEQISQEFIDLAGRDPHAMTAEEIVAAQRAFSMARKQLVDWMPIAPDVPHNTHVDMLGGWTRDDTLPFILLHNGIRPGPHVDLAALAPQVEAMNETFVGSCRQLAKKTTMAGYRAWLYRFDWSSQGAGVGSPHCVDLPFLLGDQQAWSAAPMLKGADWHEIDAVGKTMRAAWAQFARTGIPGQDWRSAEGDQPAVNILPRA